MTSARCEVCPHACRLVPGSLGACRARGNVNGRVLPLAYGRLTSIAIDPVEKKPLALWKPGSTILSVGGYGCNLRCPWCQNASISQVEESKAAWRSVLPEELALLAAQAHESDARMVGVAYTYNEPLVCWEYVRDAALFVREAGLANALVSAGCVNRKVAEGVAPLLDAANIDLKSIRAGTYASLGGDLRATQRTIEILACEPGCHLEVTTLVVPGVNDTPEEMEELSLWLASVDPSIVLHVSRFFPAWRKTDVGPTPVATVYALAEVARSNLRHVFTGNC